MTHHSSLERSDLAQTGPGTPAGELLRRYWHPVAVATALTEEHPIHPVRLLSEGLVLFRDKRGRVGLLQERCTHHGVLLYRGDVAEDCLVCPLHHWRFDTEGNCFVIAYQEKVYPINWAKARAYPVQRYAGLYWAYLGPGPVPALPHHELLGRPVGRRRITIYPPLECSWLAKADNGRDRDFKRSAQRLWVRAPVDDSHTWQLAVDFLPTTDAAEAGGAVSGPEIIYLQGEEEDEPRVQPSPVAPYYPSWAGDSKSKPEVSEQSVETLRRLLLAELERLHGDGPPGDIRYPNHLIADPTPGFPITATTSA